MVFNGKGAGKHAPKFEVRHPSGTVWLGNLPAGVTYEEVQQYMSKAGNCKRAQLTSNNTGFALFGNPQEAQNAIATLSGTSLKGSRIVVDSYAKKPGSAKTGSWSNDGKGGSWGSRSSWSNGGWRGNGMVRKTISKDKAAPKFEIRHPTGTVWLGSLPDVPFQAVQEHMSQAGTCKRVQLISGNRGFAVFSSPQEAQVAIATLNKSVLAGSKITVDSYNQKPSAKTGFPQWRNGVMGKFKIWGQPKGMQKPKVEFEIHHPTGTVWLGNLPSGVTYQEVQAHLSKAGSCKRVQLTKGETGFALFSSPQEATAAVSTLNGSKLKGTKITVDAYAKKQGSSFSGGGKYNGKGRGMPSKVKTPESTTWLGNLPEGIGYKEVQEFLSQAGTCKRVQMLKNNCAFAYMGSADEVIAAVALSGMELNGQAVVIDFYEKNQKAE